jgi:ABC-type phosphate transport system ATPase subunit
LRYNDIKAEKEMNKLLYLKIIGIRNYKNSTFEFDFTNQKTARQNDGELSNICNGIYTQNVIACTGLNASGKTTAVRLINWVLELLATGSFYPRNFHNRNIYDIFEQDVKLFLVAYSTKEKMFFKYSADFSKNEKKVLRITNDYVSYKKKTGTSKSNFLNFDYSETIKRSTVISNMKKELRDAFIVINNSIDDTISIIRYTAFYEKFPVEFEMPDDFAFNPFSTGKIPQCQINYLDNSIESIEVLEPEEGERFKIKFKNRESEVVPFYELSGKLSTGTIRWLTLIKAVIETLKSGSYMIIDEIEMSFHKALTIDIIKLFNSTRTNPHGATLIFTTHYSEILDFIHRTDSIFINSKDENGLATLTNLSTLMTRNDLSKSDIYLKGLFEVKTSPSAECFDEIIKNVIAELTNKKEDNE